MFITLPPFEFRTPPGLVHQGARCWRLMQLNLHVPWFLLSLETQDVGSGFSHVQTICFAWEADLETFLQTLDPAAVRGLVCMAPGWVSASGTWTSHSVREVWRADADDGHCLVLKGDDGSELDLGSSDHPSQEEIKRTLLLRIELPDKAPSSPSRHSGAPEEAARVVGADSLRRVRGSRRRRVSRGAP